MRITDFRNTSLQEVGSRKHNPWIGISLGNTYFTKENLQDYIVSSLKITKESLLVIIADEPHAINYEVFEHTRSDTAFAKALRKGDKVISIVSEILNEISSKDKEKVKIARWKDISRTTWYKNRLAVFSKAYEGDKSFKNALVEIVKLNMADRLDGYDSSQVEKLSLYVLHELPLFMGAIKFEEIDYDLHLYPGLSLMDDFILDLQEKKIFPELTKDIIVDTPLSIVEAYAN